MPGHAPGIEFFHVHLVGESRNVRWVEMLDASPFQDVQTSKHTMPLMFDEVHHKKAFPKESL